MKKKKLGEVLRERGHISADKLAAALQEQQGNVVLLGELLLVRGMVRKPDLIAALEEVGRVSYVDSQTVSPDPRALALVPHPVARKYCILPLSLDGPKLVAVMAEPQNLRVLDEVRFLTGMEVDPRLGFRAEILAAIEKHYAPSQAAGDDAEVEEPKIAGINDDLQMEFFATSSRYNHQQAILEFQAEMLKQTTPAVRLVSSVIAAAASKFASDIHIEPQANGAAVRIRVDGVLRELAQIPSRLQNSVVSRIKILADMDIAERRAPQDGRFLVRMGQKKLDLRVSTLPTHYGEKVVMRLLDPTAPRLQFGDLGLEPRKVELLQEILARPQGTLLVTGPTGSGKSTMLYACLACLHTPGVNIITVEDPVEYMLEGINQVQVNTKAGLTFASCLRSILRQDPNVIMVGEVRDKETAEIALKAAQTGHLVLSTLHTNDSISAVTRLIDLGIPAFLVSTSVSAIMAQRLVRRLCVCHEQVPMTREFAARLEATGLNDHNERMHVPIGCDICDQTGYRGRVGIYELLLLDEQIRSMIRSNARNEEIRLVARANGFQSMQEDALQKVQAGVTTLDEVLRVVPFEKTSSHRCSACGRELVPAFLFCPYCGSKSDASSAADRSAALQPVTRGGLYQ